MTLAKTIIHGSDADVANFLKRGDVIINEIDEYGYTPLIQTAIVSSINKAKLLLAAGAAVDFPDLTGRTALFWAADNANSELCKLLLKQKANPNSYTNSAQPVLVNPFLQKQQSIRKMLLASGAKLDFAEDFINTKILGHAFELEGRVDIVTPDNTFTEVEFAGFYLKFTLDMVTSSLIDFHNNFAGKKLREYFPKIDTIVGSLQIASELLRYQHYLVDINEHLNRINKLLTHEPLILPIAFAGHAITFIKFWHWLIRCDRGEFGTKNGTVIFYEMPKAQRFTKQIARDLIYKKQSPEYINYGLAEYLQLEPKFILPLSSQKIGNCTWANVEALIPAMILVQLLEERGQAQSKSCEEEAMLFYHEWSAWNKTRAMDFCLQGFYDKKARKSSRAAKAALLTAILFQACKYDNKDDRAKAEKILTAITESEFMEVLKIYQKIFGKDQKNPLANNFFHFLDDFGVSIPDLER